MKFFEDYNPITVFLYFIGVTGIVMLCRNIWLYVISLSFALLYFGFSGSTKKRKAALGFFFLFLICVVINPILSHNGVTVLFFINNKPITLEAFLYGISMACMIVGVFIWFFCFSQIFTSEKLIYLFGHVSLKAALLLSMSLRFIPLFARQSEKIKQSQRALGLYREDNVIDTVRGNLRVFSIMVTWSLENGIITADSMEARGYGSGHRTGFSRFCFRKKDVIVLLLIILLMTAVLIMLWLGQLQQTFYPEIKLPKWNVFSQVAYSAYGALVLLPVAVEGVR